MRARRILKTKRIGHTGTLDPFATGVLVLLVGQATRLARFVNTDEKEYLAVARCGFATDTGDLTGTRIEAVAELKPVAEGGYSAEELERAMAPLRGEIDQIPPMYSAKKVGGQKLYELARRGETIERQPVRVRIGELEPTAAFETVEPPAAGEADFAFRVVCSSGTYVRTLAESIASNLDIAAHLRALRRIRAGGFSIDQAITLEGLVSAVESNSDAGSLLPPIAALAGLPRVVLPPDDVRRALNGMRISGPNFLGEGGVSVALLDEVERLLGVGEFDAAARMIKPRIMLASA